MNPEDNYPADLGIVPVGTKCGNNMVRKLPMLLLAVTINKTYVDSSSVNFVNVFQVCYNQRCQDIKNIEVYGTNDCSAKCNNHGVRNLLTSQHCRVLYSHDNITDCECDLWQVCNHERQCHCDPGWAPPFCDVEQSELPEGIVQAFIWLVYCLCLFFFCSVFPP